MPAWQIALLVVGFLVIDFIVVGAVIAGTAGTAKELAAKFPARDIKPDAVRRDFQSVSFGSLNLGGSVHLAADDAHLHLLPAAISRWIGVRAMSIPWDQIQVTSRGPKIRTAKVSGAVLRAPTWCLDLAEPGRGQAEA